MADHTKRPFAEARACIDRLHAIEAAAKALFPAYLDGGHTEYGCDCDGCDRDRDTARKLNINLEHGFANTEIWQGPSCLFTKLAEALGVALDSGSGSEQGK